MIRDIDALLEEARARGPEHVLQWELADALEAVLVHSEKSSAAFFALSRTRDQLVAENERLRRLLEQAKIDMRQGAEKEPA